MLDQDKRYSDKKKEKKCYYYVLYFEQKLSYAFFVSFFEAGCHICEDILVLYWFGQVLLFETAI